MLMLTTILSVNKVNSYLIALIDLILITCGNAGLVMAATNWAGVGI